MRVLVLLMACGSSTPMKFPPRGDLEFAPLDDLAMSLVEDMSGRDLRSAGDLSQAAADLSRLDDLSVVADMATSMDDLLGTSSCKSILAANPSAPNGMYTINPSSGAVTVYCDMTTDGGGWTVVFTPIMSNYDSKTVDYQIPTSSSLWSDSTDALLAFRNATLGVLGDWASFAIPADWKTTAPFQADTQDVSVSVVVTGAAAVSRTLRYGKQDFNATCADAWLGPTTTWGRICIQNTVAPFFNGFANSWQDGCEDSTQSYTATYCSNTRQFTIAIR
jgi:hypothetical protein